MTPVQRSPLTEKGSEFSYADRPDGIDLYNIDNINDENI